MDNKLIKRHQKRTGACRDLALISIIATATFALAAIFDAHAVLDNWGRKFQVWEWLQIDELMIVFIILALAFGIFSLRRWGELRAEITERKRLEEELRKHRMHLEELVQERTAKLTMANEQLQKEITERKRVEEALHESETKYHIVADNTYDWEFWLSPEGQFIYTSPSCRRITGYDTEEFLADPNAFYRIIHPDDRSRFESHQYKVEQGITSGEVEFRIIRPDGTSRWIGHVCQPVFDNDGHFSGTRGSNRDITVHKQAEEEMRRLYEELEQRVIKRTALLQAANKKLESEITERKQVEERLTYQAQLLANVHDAVIATDDQFILTAWNRAAEEMYGWKAEESIGKKVSEIIRSEFTEAQGNEMLRTLAETGRYHVEVIQYRRDGKPIYVEWTTIALRDENGRITGYVSVNRDITERKRTEEALRRSEEQYRLITENTHDLICMLDQEGNFIYVSPSCREVLGCAPEELTGGSFLSLVHPDDKNAVMKTFQRALFSNGRRVEFRYKHQNGGWRNFESVWGWIFDGERNPQRAVVVSRDITERKCAEKEINMLARAIRSTIECVSITDTDNNILFVNDAFLKTYGYEKDELIGRHISVVFSQNNPDVFQEILPATLRGGWQGELLNRRKDGTEFPIFLSTSVVHDANGQPTALIGVATDITERKQAEEKMREQAALLDVAQDAIIVQDLQGIILFWNKGAERLYSWAAEEVIGKNTALFMYGTEGFQKRLEAQESTLEKGEWIGELSQVDKDGKGVIVKSRWTLVRDNDGNPRSILVVNTDITEQKQLEQQLLQAQKMESIGRLAGGVAHDFNNVLMAIMGSAEMIAMKVGSNDKLSRYVALIKQATQRGTDLAKQLLAFARLEKYTMKPIIVNEVLEETVRLLERTLEKSVDVKTRFTADVPFINGDAGQLQQVFMNLCLNARDAMPKGGTLTIETRLVVVDDTVTGKPSNLTSGNYVEVSISDTGIGIDEKIRQHIFEPFFTTKEQGKGTGLGLAVVYGIVQSHKGFVTVESTVGVGTTFRVYFPISEFQPRTEVSEVETEKEQISGEGTILVVDDEEMILDLSEELLTDLGYQVLKAGSGEESIEMYRKRGGEIDLVILDLAMPKIDGEEAFRQLKALNSDVKVLIASGLIEPEHRRRMEEAGIAGFLQKPYRITELAKTIQAVVKGRSIEHC